jgi:predicted AlkP superfamily phosphohydrolase/phosphomutase
VRTLIVGWDGADWRILDPLLERGDLPNLGSVVERGGRAVLRSTRPTHSWSAWPSFLTGLDPDEHGVFDILEARDGGRREYPVSFRSIRAPTFLADLSEAGLETVAVNIPLTFPPPRIRGKLVAGGVLPKGRPFTHPESLAAELEAAGTPWPINGMSWTTFRHRPEPFLEEVEAIVRARQAAAERLLDTTAWEVACVVFVAPDRVQHCLSQYVSPDHPDYPVRSREPLADRVRGVYRLLDEGLGRLLARTGPEDLVVVMSDHGMHACTGAVHMDRLLAHLGFLRFSRSNLVFGPMQWGAVRAVARKVYDRLGLHGRVRLPQAVDWSRTRAYTRVRSTGEGVSVNLRGREPEGTVAPEDYGRVREEVARALTSFTDPRTGLRPVARVWRREELFRGRFADEAPDLLLEPHPLYSLSHARSPVEPADWLSGDHRIEGILAAAGPTVDRTGFPEEARLVDLAPTVLAAAGAPSSVRHAGQPLAALVGAGAGVAAGPRWDRGEEERFGGLAESEVAEVEEHLRGLGYLE